MAFWKGYTEIRLQSSGLHPTRQGGGMGKCNQNIRHPDEVVATQMADGVMMA